MALNQDCAEQMLMVAAHRCLNQKLRFRYDTAPADLQIDISPAFMMSPDNQKQAWYSGHNEESLIADINRLDREKVYFLRTGPNGRAGHYQVLYFDEGNAGWQCYSSENNHYRIFQSGGRLSERAQGALLVTHKTWGMEEGQYTFLVVEASEENIIRAANYVYQLRTQGEATANENLFRPEKALLDSAISISSMSAPLPQGVEQTPRETLTDYENKPRQNADIQQLINRLNAYIKRIDDNRKTAKYSKYESDFYFMNKSRGANRKANYKLAKNLRDSLQKLLNEDAADILKTCANIFSGTKIKSLRPKVKGGYRDRGINSSELNGILKAGTGVRP